jgi:hypothetical protein
MISDPIFAKRCTGLVLEYSAKFARVARPTRNGEAPLLAAQRGR